MPEGHDTTIEVINIMSFVLYTQILKQSVLKPASPGITLTRDYNILHQCSPFMSILAFDTATFVWITKMYFIIIQISFANSSRAT